MSWSDPNLPLVIPYDGPGDSDDEEPTTPAQLSDPLLRPVSWEELRTLDGRSTVLGSRWGQFYKLEYDTDSAWEKSYRISQAVKSLEDAAEEARRKRDANSLLGAGGGGLFGSAPPGSTLNSGPSVFGGFGSGAFGQATPTPSLFGSPRAPMLNSGSITFGGSGPSTLGQSALTSAKPFLGAPDLTAFFAGIQREHLTSSFGAGTGAKGVGVIAIENYALMEIPSYPPTAIDGLQLRDWFTGGTDNLENAFLSSLSATETLRSLLLAISQPGFSVLLSLKLRGHKPDVLRVSCACAYAIRILYGQGAEYFDFVLSHAPAGVLLDIALFARGALIGSAMKHRVLQAAAIALTSPELKDSKEVMYARAVAVMVAGMISQFYKENAFAGDEGKRAGILETRISTLIKDVFEAPVTPPPSPRAAITAAAALCALILAGALTFADELQQRREKNQLRAELVVSATLSCIGFAVPVPYLAAAGGLATVLGTMIVRHIWRPKDPGLRAALVVQTLQSVLWPLVRRRELLNFGLVGLSFEEASEFKMFFELVVQSAWMGYWQRG